MLAQLDAKQSKSFVYRWNNEGIHLINISLKQMELVGKCSIGNFDSENILWAKATAQSTDIQWNQDEKSNSNK